MELTFLSFRPLSCRSWRKEAHIEIKERNPFYEIALQGNENIGEVSRSIADDQRTISIRSTFFFFLSSFFCLRTSTSIIPRVATYPARVRRMVSLLVNGAMKS